MRNQLFTQMFQDYMLYLEKEDVEFAFDTDLMHSLLDAFEKIDFTKLGLMEDYDDVDKRVVLQRRRQDPVQHLGHCGLPDV